VLRFFLEPCGITIIILFYFLFVTNFESPKIDLPIKRYVNCKLCTFQTLNLEYVWMANLCPDISLNFESFRV
jgi:hypothetical protein